MKVDTQNVASCKVKVIVKAEADETRKEYEEVIKTFMQQGRVPGFRPGKVPREIIKRDFHKEITEEVQGRLFRALYRQALDQQGIKMVSLLDVSDMLFSPETGITFTLTVDVQPDFDLPKYKKIPVVFEDPAVTEAQVDEHIDRLRKAFAKFEEAPAGHPIEAGDLVSIDFTGLIDGKPVKEVAAEAKAISEGTDFWIQVEEDRFIPEVVNALKGMKAGEATEVKFKFGKDQPVEALRGKKAVYSVTVKTVRMRVLPKDEDLLTQVKLESLDKLREQTRTHLTESAQQAEKQRREQTVIEFLLKKTEFDLPESQVAEEINTTLDRMANEAHYRGLTREDMEKNREAIIENATESAKRQLRLRYILGKVADQEGITLTDDEVRQKIETLAAEFHTKPEQLRAQIEKNERMGLLRSQIRDEKTLRFLLEEAKH
ncbi:MAG TPA: trigger factor [Kiritimatiellia bacterium]|nr:trigger factor [Kiritimatiellia bacterium]HPS08935.1 trigger factor [Kiritimatiellia bacterium]